MRVVASLALGVASWLATMPASADDRIGVAVVADGEDATETTGLRARVEHELTSRGHVPVDIGVDDPALALSDESLRAAARAHDSVVVVLVRPSSEHGVEIHLITSASGASLHRVLDGDTDPSTIALTTAELVDAALAELATPPKPPAPTPAPAVRVVAPPVVVPPPPRRWYATLAVGVLWPVLQPTPVATSTLTIGARVARRASIGVEGMLPLHPMIEHADGSSILLQPFAIGARVDADPLPLRSRVRLDLGGGLAATAVLVDVAAAAPSQGHPTTVWSAAATIALALRGDFSDRVRLAGGVRGWVPLQHLRVFAGETMVGDFGGAWLQPYVELGVRW